MKFCIVLNIEKIIALKTILVDVQSHLVKHVIEKSDKYSKIEDFNTIGKSYRNDTFKRNVVESLSKKDTTPTLNTHEKTLPLNLSD